MSRIFEKKYRVPASDVNFANHVDNQIYLRWMNEIAFEHSDDCGWAMQNYLDLGAAFVVKSHFIDYLAPTFEHEDLLLVTWISGMDTRRCTRTYEFYKLADFRPFMRAETKWVFVDLLNGRPMDIPEQVANAFESVSAELVAARIQTLKTEQ